MKAPLLLYSDDIVFFAANPISMQEASPAHVLPRVEIGFECTKDDSKYV